MNLADRRDLFGTISIEEPVTEGIKYIGSKKKLLSQILTLAGNTGAKSVLDGFSGSTRVSQAFARGGYKVCSNDREVWPFAFANCYLRAKTKSKFVKLINHLNNVRPHDGWFTENYGGDPKEANPASKRPWQRHNTRLLDGIRVEIDRLGLDQIEKHVAITSLIRALDQVDSTLGHYASYLREWSPRSYNQMVLSVPNIVDSHIEHTVRCTDVFEVAKEEEADLAYYDPPYGSNNEKMPPSRVRYSSYYHVWSTICLNDKPPIFGKANRRADSRDHLSSSVFEDFRQNSTGRFLAVEAIRELLACTRAKNIILSYSSGGRATAEELNEAIYSVGKLREVVEVDHKQNVMAGMTWTGEWLRNAAKPHREFLFLIEK